MRAGIAGPPDIDGVLVTLESEAIEVEELKQELGFRDQLLVLSFSSHYLSAFSGHLTNQFGRRVVMERRQINQLCELAWFHEAYVSLPYAVTVSRLHLEPGHLEVCC